MGFAFLQKANVFEPKFVLVWSRGHWINLDLYYWGEQAGAVLHISFPSSPSRAHLVLQVLLVHRDLLVLQGLK